MDENGRGGMDFTILWAWTEFVARWTHVITAITWIGSSFYFIALDLGLRKVPELPPGAHGEEWQVHAAASIISRSTSWHRRACRAI